MRIARVAMFAALGVVIALAVGLGVYLVSGRPLRDLSPVVPISSAQIGSPRPSPSPSPTTTPSVDDRGGRCSEPEHSADPECQDGGSDDNSGSGSSGSNSGSGGSGGSGSSGSGGGDD